MNNQLTNKLYKTSRLILTIMTLIIFNIMFINEDIDWKILSIIFALITFGVSFPSTIISKKIINIENKIESKMLKILYYVIVLPIIICVFFVVIALFFKFIYSNIPTPSDFGAQLGQALLGLFFITIGIICIVVPYIQTLIVLILKKYIKS